MEKSSNGFSKCGVVIGRISILVAILATGGQSLEIGAWVGGPELPYPFPTNANVENFLSLQQRRLDQSVIYSVFDESWSFTREYANIAADHGAIPVVTWMANGYPTSDIVAGKADSRITAYAKGIKSWGKPIWLRPLHEFNGDWYDWGTKNPSGKNSDSSVIAAWKHIVQIFRNEGVTNVKWVWCPNTSDNVSFVNAYPGDEWVDFVALDGYNWGASRSWSSWRSFESVFASSYKQITTLTSKPLFLAEFGSSAKGGDKAKWIRDAFAVMGTKFPKIFAVNWFNAYAASDSADWQLTTSQAAVDAWKESIARYAPPSDLLVWNFEDTVSASAKSGGVPGAYAFGNAASTVSVSNTLVATAGSAVHGAVSPVCSFAMGVDPGTKYAAYAGCGVVNDAANMTGTLRFSMSVKVKDSGTYRINLSSDRYSQANIASGALLGWDVSIGASSTGRFLSLPVAALAVPSWAKADSAIVKALPSVATALLGVNGFSIQAVPTWRDSSTISSPLKGWIQLDQVRAEGITKFVPSSLIPTSFRRFESGVRPAGLVRTHTGTLRNESGAVATLVSTSGRGRIRIEPGEAVHVPEGVWMIRSALGSRTVVVP